MRLAAGAFTHRGQRRPVNEDSHVIDERLTLFAIADGMGGHRAGDVASQTAIEALRAAVANGRPVNDAIVSANAAVREVASRNDDYEGMGTTMTAAVVAGGRRLLIGHVGDSRGYLLKGGSLSRVTEDHSLVEQLVRDGRITPEQAESHPQRAYVTRALGIDAEVEVDLYSVEVDAGDRLILCSDGLTTMVRERDVERIARGEPDPQRAAELLVDAANEAGGDDNITVVIVDILEVDDDVTPDPETMVLASEPPAPVPEPAPEPEAVAPPEPKPSLARRTRSVLLIAIPVVVVIAVAVAVTGWYARNSYYVGADGGEVVLYQGVPGGVFGWDPTIERRTDLRVSQLDTTDEDAVLAGAAKGSQDEAEAYILRLEMSVTTTSTTTTSTSTSTTTTTTLPVPTTLAPAIPVP